MLIRPATESDLQVLLALDQACFADPWSAEGILAELQLAHCRPWVLERDAEVLGSLLAWRLYEELQINRVAVWQELRGQGIGRELVEHALLAAAAEGAETALLEVRADNTAAIALYQRTGFARTGLRRQYYSDGTDALVMSACLQKRQQAD